VSVPEEPVNHVVRFSKEARENIVSIAYELFKRTKNVEVSLSLSDEFHTEAGKLAFLPERNRVQEHESALLGRTVRRVLVRHWHLYYEIIPDSDDGPLVRVIFLRDARRTALLPDEIDRIVANQ
jgi:hypothetical protein